MINLLKGHLKFEIIHFDVNSNFVQNEFCGRSEQLCSKHFAVSSWPQRWHKTSSDFLQTCSKHLVVKGWLQSLQIVSWAFLYFVEHSVPCSCCLRRLTPLGLSFDPTDFCFITFRDLLPTWWWLVGAENIYCVSSLVFIKKENFWNKFEQVDTRDLFDEYFT